MLCMLALDHRSIPLYMNLSLTYCDLCSSFAIDVACLATVLTTVKVLWEAAALIDNAIRSLVTYHLGIHKITNKH